LKLSLVSIPVQDPIKAHEIYTSKLGFVSKEFDADAQVAIVVSAEDSAGTAMFLEPCRGSFAESYQKSAFEANLPIMIFGVNDVEAELDRLKAAGIKVRPELNKPEWGLMNMFEDGCGNILMLEEISDKT
jgi:predicted enzyme related to lactoylglutathione lyase